MVPLVIATMRHGTKWGLLTCGIYGIIQCITGFHNVLYAKTLLTQAGVVVLDYFVAYLVIGLVFVIAKTIPHDIAAVAIGTIIVGLLRYLCHFVSGVLIWGEWAPAGTQIWIYSLTYNGSYMLPEIAITAIGAVLVMKILEKPRRIG